MYSFSKTISRSLQIFFSYFAAIVSLHPHGPRAAAALLAAGDDGTPDNRCPVRSMGATEDDDDGRRSPRRQAGSPEPAAGPRPSHEPGGTAVYKRKELLALI
jgi:hypothetical protein